MKRNTYECAKQVGWFPSGVQETGPCFHEVNRLLRWERAVGGRTGYFVSKTDFQNEKH